jgi:hypothetical protein
LKASNMPDNGFGRCDGHHEMVDFRLEKNTVQYARLEKSPERAGAFKVDQMRKSRAGGMLL